MNLRKIIALLAAAAGCLNGVASAQYHLVARFPVGGDASRVDYLRVDTVNRHLFVAHDKRFEVLDVDTGKKVGEIGPTSRAHGVALVPELNRGFATSGNTSTIVMFDLKSLQTLAVIKSSGKNPDGIEYDPDTKKIYAANGGSGSITVIDPQAGKVVGTIEITDPKEGKLEAMAFEGDGRAFVNNEEKTSMHVFDTHAMKVLDTWSLAPGEGGTGMAIDPESHRVFAACGNNKLVVVDSASGKVVATPAIGGDPDAAAFDPDSKLIFVSNSDSTMTILHEDSADSYSVLQTVETGKGAKTSCFSEGRVYLPVMKFGPAAAPTKEVPEPRPPVIPGSLQIIVLGR